MDQFKGVDVSHLSERAKKKLLEEMNQGASRSKQFDQMHKQLAREPEAASLSEVDAEQLVARRVAAEEEAAKRAQEAQEAAYAKVAEKEAADFNEVNVTGRVPVYSDKVQEEAETLAEKRLEVDPNADAPVGEGQEEARLANNQKEIQDRIESTTDATNTAFQAPSTGVVDTGPRYDEDGNLIENNEDGTGLYDPAAHPDPVMNPTPDELAIEGTEQPKRRGRRPASPANAVGTGPKSE